MATIPTIRTAQTRPSAPPTPIRGTGNLSGTFGENAARAGVRAGEQTQRFGAEIRREAKVPFEAATALAQATQQQKAREDALRRIVRGEKVEAEVQGLILDAQRGGNLADPDQVTELRSKLSQVYERARQEYPASGLLDDAPRFSEELKRQESKTTAMLVQMGLAAADAQLKIAVEKRVNTFSGEAALNPGGLADLQGQFIDFMESNSAAMTPEEQQAQTLAGLATMSAAAVRSYIADGSLDAAEEAMRNPLIAPYLAGGKLQLELKAEIANHRKERDKLNAQIATRIGAMNSLGVWDRMTPDEQNRVMVSIVSGVDLGKTPLTPKQELERVNRALTDNGFDALDEDQAKKFLGAYIETDEAGSSRQERDRARTAELRSTLRNGSATVADVEEYLAILTENRQPNIFGGVSTEMSPADQQVLSEILGLSPRDFASPDGMEAALRLYQTLGQEQAQAAPGQPFAQPAAPAGQPAAPAGQPAASAEQPVAPAGQPATTTFGINRSLEPSGEIEVEARTPLQEEAAETPDQELPPEVISSANEITQAAESAEQQGGTDREVVNAFTAQGHTLFNLTDMVQGISASVGRSTSGLTGLGEIIEAPEMNAAIQSYNRMLTRLANAMKDTDLRGIAELEFLFSERELGALTPSMFRSPGSVRDKWIGLDIALAKQAEDIQGILDDEGSGISKDRFAQLSDQLEAIKDARAFIGAPPTFTTPEEFFTAVEEGQLKPGAWVNWQGAGEKGLRRYTPDGGAEQ